MNRADHPQQLPIQVDGRVYRTEPVRVEVERGSDGSRAVTPRRKTPRQAVAADPVSAWAETDKPRIKASALFGYSQRSRVIQRGFVLYRPAISLLGGPVIQGPRQPWC